MVGRFGLYDYVWYMRLVLCRNSSLDFKSWLTDYAGSWCCVCFGGVYTIILHFLFVLLFLHFLNLRV